MFPYKSYLHTMPGDTFRVRFEITVRVVSIIVIPSHSKARVNCNVIILVGLGIRSAEIFPHKSYLLTMTWTHLGLGKE